jgi:hypothetical protein
MAKKAKPKANAEAQASAPEPQAPAVQPGPWVTCARHPERGVHQIDARDFDPRRHARVAAPLGREDETGPTAGDGAPEVSVQEAAERAAVALAAQPETNNDSSEPAEG